MLFLFSLLQIRFIPKSIIFYIVFQDTLQSQVATHIYAPLQESPGFLKKGIRQFEVLDSTVIVPTGEEVSQSLWTRYKRVLLGGIGYARQ